MKKSSHDYFLLKEKKREDLYNLKNIETLYNSDKSNGIKFCYARALYQTGIIENVKKAEKLFHELLGSPQNDNAVIFLTKCSLTLNKISDIEKFMIKAEKKRTYYKVIFKVAQYYYYNGNLDKAEEDFFKLVCSPFRDSSLLYLGLISKQRKDFDKARFYFKGIENLFFKNKAKTEDLFIDITTEKYRDLKEKCEKIIMNQELKGDNLFYTKLVYMLSCTKLNEEENKVFNLDNIKKIYTGTQIKNYDEKRALCHIKNHNYTQDEEKKHNVFTDKSIATRLFYTLPNILGDSTFVENRVLDNHLLRINNIGTDGEDYLKIITIPHTNKIVTMYPVDIMKEALEKDEYKLAKSIDKK